MQNHYKLIIIVAALTLANFVKGHTTFLSSDEHVTQDYWGAASNQICNSENELRFQRKEIVNLFNLQLGEKFSLSLIDENNKVIQLAGSIVNYESKGENSGVLNIQLSNGSTNYKLLLTRKLSPKNTIEYSIVLIDKVKNEWYKLTEETPKEFVLSLTDQKKIIME
jgi:hypothetical protein